MERKNTQSRRKAVGIPRPVVGGHRVGGGGLEVGIVREENRYKIAQKRKSRDSVHLRLPSRRKICTEGTSKRGVSKAGTVWYCNLLETGRKLWLRVRTKAGGGSPEAYPGAVGATRNGGGVGARAWKELPKECN